MTFPTATTTSRRDASRLGGFRLNHCRFRRSASIAFFVAILAVMSFGCGGEKEAEVTGIVRFEGEPVKSGAISFYPVDGKSRTSGSEIHDGEYRAKVPYGAMIVRINAAKVVGKRKLYENNPKSPEVDITAEALPARYNDKSELKLEANEAKIKRDFDLTK